MTNFATWSHENLIKFAEEANAKMIEQADDIQYLQRDLKDAIEGYRTLMRQQQPPPT